MKLMNYDTKHLIMQNVRSTTKKVPCTYTSCQYQILCKLIRQKKITKQFFDVHLMLDNPEEYIDAFANAGADGITIHLEGTKDIPLCISKIKDLGLKVGIAINPDTDVQGLVPYLKDIDMVLVMSVEPGFGGQSFMPDSLDKVRTLVAMREQQGLDFIIEIDGGISSQNAGEVFAAGAEALVAGSAVFGAANPEAEIVKMLEA